MMHAPNDEHRQLQRRLSVLSALQQETIKLERKQRDERRTSFLTSSAVASDEPRPALRKHIK